MKKVMMGVLAMSMVTATVPLCAESASVAAPVLSAESVRGSIERAIVLVDAGAEVPLPARRPLSVSVQQQFASTAASPTPSGDPQLGPTGGGGSHLGTILTLVGTAISVAGAVYYLKIIKKETSPTPTN